MDVTQTRRNMNEEKVTGSRRKSSEHIISVSSPLSPSYSLFAVFSWPDLFSYILLRFLEYSYRVARCRSCTVFQYHLAFLVLHCTNRCCSAADGHGPGDVLCVGVVLSWYGVFNLSLFAIFNLTHLFQFLSARLNVVGLYLFVVFSHLSNFVRLLFRDIWVHPMAWISTSSYRCLPFSCILCFGIRALFYVRGFFFWPLDFDPALGRFSPSADGTDKVIKLEYMVMGQEVIKSQMESASVLDVGVHIDHHHLTSPSFQFFLCSFHQPSSRKRSRLHLWLGPCRRYVGVSWFWRSGYHTIPNSRLEGLAVGNTVVTCVPCYLFNGALIYSHSSYVNILSFMKVDFPFYIIRAPGTHANLELHINTRNSLAFYPLSIII